MGLADLDGVGGVAEAVAKLANHRRWLNVEAESQQALMATFERPQPDLINRIEGRLLVMIVGLVLDAENHVFEATQATDVLYLARVVKGGYGVWPL